MVKDCLIFAHLADLHIGAHRDKELKNLNFQAVEKAFNQILKENVNFVLISGDLFNHFHIPLEFLQKFFGILKKFYERKIPIYAISGSHDLSSKRETYLDILDTIGYIKYLKSVEPLNEEKYVLKPLINDKLKLIVAGVDGMRNQLEKKILKNLKIKDNSLPKNYFKIFLFHSTINELVSELDKNVGDGISIKYLPKGFDYYAGGHIHKNIFKNIEGYKISYSGALFPNNFSELLTEKPNFNICKYDFKTKSLKVKKVVLELYEKEYFEFDLTNLTPTEARNKILERLESSSLKEKIVLLKLKGTLEGRASELKISEFIDIAYEKGAKVVLRNTRLLRDNFVIEELYDESKEFSETEIIKDFYKNLQESDIIDPEKSKKEEILIKKILKEDFEKIEGETNKEYEERITKQFKKIIFTKGN